MHTEDRPGIREKLSFGIGDFCCNGMFVFISTYLMIYYTDTVGIDLKALGIIMLLGRITDAAFSPVAGAFIDRTNTRWGKCRPFMILWALPTCILGALLFFIPSSFSAKGKVVYAVCVYIFYSFCFTFMNIPYNTLISVLSPDHRERLSLNKYKTVGANIGAILVSCVTLTLSGALQKNGQNGYLLTAVFYEIIFFAAALICFLNTKERVSIKSEKKLSLKESADGILKNKPWLIYVTVQLFTLLGYMTRIQGTTYYAKYVLKNEAAGSFMLGMMYVVGVVGSLFLPKLAEKAGMKNCVMGGTIVWAVGMAGTWFAEASLPGVIFFHVVYSIGWIVSTGMIFVILSQTIDYAEWKTGKRPQGILTSLLSFLQKVGIALSGYLCSAVLDLGGYEANAEASASSLFSMRLLFAGIPFIFCIIVLVLMSFYHLDKEYPRIMAELEKRRN